MSVYYDLYLKDVFDLAHSFVIKSETTCRLMNDYVAKLRQPVNNLAPETWRYYRHLSGEYHPIDEVMEIVSLDTTETIVFNKANLDRHKATRREYNKRGIYLDELIEAYPDQELLIRGIVNPIDAQTAIAANNHTILYYNKTLVEVGESRFIYKLQERIDQFYLRWDNPAFVYGDVYYPAGLEAVFYTSLVQFIINIRLDECKTDFAHSFHIKEYLKSNGRLDLFYDFMTDKQRLYFYRNLIYLNRNAGKHEVFDELTQKVLTDRAFPLAEYNLQQSDADILETLKPSVQMYRKSINNVESATSTDYRSVLDILQMEATLAIDNENEIVHAAVQIPRMMGNSLHGDLETKVLESHTVNTSQSDIYNLQDILLNHWIYMSTTGMYTSTVAVTNPLTGDTMRIGVKDAFIIYLYAYNAARGFKLEYIPTIEAKRVVRNPKPSRDTLLGFIDTSILSPEYVDYAYDLGHKLEEHISVESFRNSMDTVHNSMIKHREMWALRKDWRQRIHVKMMTEHFYMDYPCNLANDQDYDSWFSERAIDLRDLSELEMELLSNEIITSVTGADLRVGKTFQEIHEAMVKLMERLSSYSVQFIQKTNSLNVVYTDRPYIRPGQQELFRKHLQKIKLTPFRVFTFKAKSKHHWVVNSGVAGIVHQKTKSKHKVITRLAWVIKQNVRKRAHDTAKFTFGLHKVPPTKISLKDVEGTINGYLDLEFETFDSIFRETSSALYTPFTPAETSYYRGKLDSLSLQ